MSIFSKAAEAPYRNPREDKIIAGEIAEIEDRLASLLCEAGRAKLDVTTTMKQGMYHAYPKFTISRKLHPVSIDKSGWTAATIAGTLHSPTCGSRAESRENDCTCAAKP